MTYLFSTNLVNALCRTLLHSLWQGALLSGVTGLIVSCTRRTPAATRYKLLISAMALFAVTMAVTFYLEYNGDGAPITDNRPISPEAGTAGAIAYQASPNYLITETIGSYLNRYGSVIVWIWFWVVCARCILLAGGLREVYRLRHKNISGVGSHWEDRVRELCVQLGIKRLVGIAQSGLAKTPMVTGHLKPLILVPLGILTTLSPEEAEAVLRHELAHIRRSDYLVNLLQNILEIVFFFNPAVLWLSSLIKAERENCCDDMAVAASGKINYLRALVACEEYDMPYAMALKSTNGGLKQRVARVISNKNQSLNGREKSLLAVCLIAAGIFATAFVNGGGGQKTATQTDSAWTKNMIGDLLKDGIITGPDNLSFKIGTDEFVVNYKKQPDAIYRKYRAKYVSTRYHEGADWIWYYEFDSQKWAAMIKGSPADDAARAKDTATGIFKGKAN